MTPQKHNNPEPHCRRQTIDQEWHSHFLELNTENLIFFRKSISYQESKH